MNDTILTCIDQIRLLGVEVCNDLSWKANTSSIVNKAFGRLTVLRKLVCFGVTDLDLVNIYILFIRSKLEYNCVVWHSTITVDKNDDIERVQKCSVRVILQERFTNYEEGLNVLGLEDLKSRRERLCLEFARICVETPGIKDWFPRNHQNPFDTRNQEQYKVTFANNERFKNSTIPYLQRLLNSN